MSTTPFKRKDSELIAVRRVGLAIGFESMSAGNDRAPTKFSEDFKTHPEASDAGQVRNRTPGISESLLIFCLDANR